MKGNSTTNQYLAAVLICVATVAMGLCSSWPTPVIPKLLANETDIDITKHQIAWMLAMSSPGFISGSFMGGITSDRIGRRATILCSALPYSIGMLGMAFARAAWLLYIMLFLWNWGTGMICIALPLYFAEISSKDVRATLLLITRTAFNLGNLLMMCVGPFMTYRSLNYALLVFPIAYFTACWWIPESPYWYLKEGKVESARKSLMVLRNSYVLAYGEEIGKETPYNTSFKSSS